jgi:flagellar export protein FliJ
MRSECSAAQPKGFTKMAAKDKYSLQRLLEMRERARDDAAFYVAECRREQTVAENELQKREQAVEDCRQEQSETQNALVEKSRSGMKSSEMVGYRQRLADLRENEISLLNAVEDQKVVVERAEKKTEKALDGLNEAAKEVKVIEKHRENWQTEKKIEVERREQKINDEIGAILHERQKFE